LSSETRGGGLAVVAPLVAAWALLSVIAIDLGGANARAYLLAPPGILSEPSPLADRLRADLGLPRVVTPFLIAPERWPDLSEYEASWRWLVRTAGPATNVPRHIGNFQPYTGMPPARLLRFRLRTDPGAIAARSVRGRAAAERETVGGASAP
jgi:hypothetical protein